MKEMNKYHSPLVELYLNNLVEAMNVLEGMGFQIHHNDNDLYVLSPASRDDIGLYWSDVHMWYFKDDTPDD